MTRFLRLSSSIFAYCKQSKTGGANNEATAYLLIDCLLEVRAPLTQVLEDLQGENLMTSEWTTLENLHPLLKPFAQYASLFSGEEYTTTSSVIQLLWKSTFT